MFLAGGWVEDADAVIIVPSPRVKSFRLTGENAMITTSLTFSRRSCLPVGISQRKALWVTFSTLDGWIFSCYQSIVKQKPIHRPSTNGGSMIATNQRLKG